MTNRKQKDRLLFKMIIGIYLSFVLYNIIDRYIIPHPGYHWETTGIKTLFSMIETKLVKDKKELCNISKLCAGHNKKEHLKWDREGEKLAAECKKNNYKCHPFRD